MDKTAIKEIIDNATVQAQMQKPVPGNVVALPDNYLLHDLSCFAPQARFFTRNFTTSNLQAFVDYVKAYAPAATTESTKPTLFVNPANGSAVMAFDEGTPDHPGQAKHVAQIKVSHTAEARALFDGLNGAKLSQRSLIDTLEDWPENIIPYAGEKQMTIAQAVAAIRNADINHVRRTNSHLDDEAHRSHASASLMTQVESASEHLLPTTFAITLSAYAGAPAFTFHVRVVAAEDGSVPVFRTRVIAYERHVAEINSYFLSVIRDSLSTVTDIYEGTI